MHFKTNKTDRSSLPPSAPSLTSTSESGRQKSIVTWLPFAFDDHISILSYRDLRSYENYQTLINGLYKKEASIINRDSI